MLFINLKDYGCTLEDIYCTFTKLGYIVEDCSFMDYKNCAYIRWNMNNEIC